MERSLDVLARGTFIASLVAVALLASAPSARGAETTLTFDDLAANTVVNTQYAGRGVTFGPSVSGQTQVTRSLPVVANVGTTAAASGANVGRVQRACFSLECSGTAETWAQFSSAQARVRVSVGAFGTQANTITVTGFNASGVQVAQAQASAPGGTFRTSLSLSVASATMRFIRVRGSTIGTFGIDSLFISDQPSTGPDFSISVAFGPHVVQQGQTINVPVTLTRRNSSGTIRLTASGLPSGVTGTAVDHTLVTASALASSTTLNLPLTGAANAPPNSFTTVTVTATPLTKTAGVATQSLSIQVRVLVLYDLRVIGVEPTQGIQSSVFAFGSTATSARYAGVPLQYLGRTIVRVYANTPRGGFPVGFVGMRLRGFGASGAELPGSPLFADNGSRTVPFSTNPRPSVTERSTAASAFTFTLPPSWTGVPGATTQSAFGTRLRAELVQPTGTVSFRECDGCAGNDVMELTDVGYTPTCCVTAASAIITATGGSTPRPIDQIMAPGLNLIPLQINLKPYGTTLDLSSAVETTKDGNKIINHDQAVDRLLAFNQRDGGGEVVLGILSPEFSDGYGALPFGIFDDLRDRPFTSSAHELGHALGRPHASKSCGGDDGEGWPPDETGLIQGFGLDRRTTPYRVFATPLELEQAPPASGDSRAFYDLMSYCAFAGSGDPNAWISVKGWTDFINRWRGGVLQPAALSRAAAVAPRTAGTLQVNASVDAAGGARILSVRPLTPKPQPGLSPTLLRLVVRDAAGAVLSDIPMSGRTFVVDRGGAPPTVVEAAAAVDPAAAASVEVMRDGVVLARRERSPNAPVSAFLSPRKGQLVGRGEKLSIRWRASDPDGGPLEATLEWSSRGGRPGTWRTVSIGPDGGSVALPSDYFAGSAEAALRLRINDGFNETVVLSPPFRTIHRRPVVRIVNPRAQAQLPRGAVVSLQARAIDERQQEISGDRVIWFDGRRPIARGERAAVRLRAGVHRLRAVARDALGRRGSATVRVRVVPAAPSFTLLEVPARVAPLARRLQLRVATSFPGRLVVQGAARTTRTRVGQATRRVTVPIPRSTGVLRLRLVVGADGVTRTVPLEIERR